MLKKTKIMEDSFLNEVDSEDYCYKFEVPFYLKVNNVFKKVVDVFEKYDISNVKLCRDEIRELNIDDAFFDEFIVGDDGNGEVYYSPEYYNPDGTLKDGSTNFPTDAQIKKQTDALLTDEQKEQIRIDDLKQIVKERGGFI